MKELLILPTDDSPMIKGDPLHGTVEISGKSLPEDVSSFYSPLLNWLNEFTENPKDIDVSFKMNYFNTASSKLILDILVQLEEIKKAGNNVRVFWHYPEFDQEMHEAGVEYSEMVDLKFEFIALVNKDVKQ